MIVLSPFKSDVGVGVGPKKSLPRTLTVSNNYPNPFSGRTSIGIHTFRSGNLVIEVTNLVGEKVLSMDCGVVNSGSCRYTIDAGHLSPGIYFYTVRLGSECLSRKMIVQ